MNPVQKKIGNNLLVVAKQYLSEFDPDSGPIGSGPCLNLFNAWKDYFQAFEDMCQVQNVPEENEKSLFLLLAGLKFRARLNEILSGSENAPNDLSEIVAIMEDYFRNKATLQGLRFDFFYGNDSKPDFEVESQFEWVERLSKRAELCEFSSMSPNEAISIVMSKYEKKEIIFGKRKLNANQIERNVFKKPKIENHTSNEMEVEQVDENIEILSDNEIDPLDFAEIMEEESFSNEDFETEGKNSKKKYQCTFPECSYFTFKPSHLKIHEARHSVLKGFVCGFESCEHKFITKFELTRHQVSHSKNRPFKCLFCDKSFKRKDHLNKHTLSCQTKVREKVKIEMPK